MPGGLYTLHSYFFETKSLPPSFSPSLELFDWTGLTGQ